MNGMISAGIYYFSTVIGTVVTVTAVPKSGFCLERYFRQRYMETGKYNIVTNYWDRNGEDEIDLVAVNETDRIIEIGEIKRNKNKIDMNILKQKAGKIIEHHKGWDIRFIALSLEDM